MPEPQSVSAKTKWKKIQRWVVSVRQDSVIREGTCYRHLHEYSPCLEWLKLKREEGREGWLHGLSLEMCRRLDKAKAQGDTSPTCPTPPPPPLVLAWPGGLLHAHMAIQPWSQSVMLTMPWVGAAVPVELQLALVELWIPCRQAYSCTKSTAVTMSVND